MMRSTTVAIACALVMSTTIAIAAPSAAFVEARLLAPCCYQQTLDVHESPLASDLRAEVSRRVAAGEPASAIEDDFAVRYGERVRAIPKGKDTRAIGYASGAVVATAALALAVVVSRWRRGARVRRPTLGNERDELDARIDDELRALDG
jgi:cytochrome c-type biogenesis protein CcmH